MGLVPTTSTLLVRRATHCATPALIIICSWTPIVVLCVRLMCKLNGVVTQLPGKNLCHVAYNDTCQFMLSLFEQTTTIMIKVFQGLLIGHRSQGIFHQTQLFSPALLILLTVLIRSLSMLLPDVFDAPYCST